MISIILSTNKVNLSNYVRDFKIIKYLFTTIEMTLVLEKADQFRHIIRILNTNVDGK